MSSITARDAKIEAAISNWAPRFTSQGVDPSDFVRVTQPLERWDEWLDAWLANGERHAALAREAESAGRTLTAGDAWVHAALSYHFAKFVWMVDMERYRAAADRAVAALYEAHRLLDPSAQRVEVPFEGATLVGNLRGARDRPLVFLLPGLDSTKEEFFNWEEVFLRRGLSTFSFDGPGQGESGYATHIRPDYEAATSAALDTLGWARPVGVVGVSLGGYYAPRALSGDERFRAGVSVSGAFCFGEVWDARPSLTKETFQHHSGARDQDEARARAFELDLDGVAQTIRQPLLVITGKLDRLVQWEESKKIADAAPNSTWVLFEEGNHVCNNIPYRYRPLAADWIAEQIAP